MGRRFKIRKVASPAYQVAERFADLIRRGKLKAGEWLPPTRSLADDLGVDREIIRKAYIILKNDGLIEVVPRVGTRVAEKKVKPKEDDQIPLADAVERVLSKSRLGTGSSPRAIKASKTAAKKSPAKKKKPAKSKKQS